MQPPGLEGLLAPPGAFSNPHPPPLLPPHPHPHPSSPPPSMNPGYPPDAPPDPPKPPPHLPYGYFSTGFYPCRLPRATLKPPPATPGPFPTPEKFLENPGGSAEDFQGFYPGYGAAPYQVPGYLDMSVLPALAEPRHDALVTVDGGCHQAWGWGGQMCCAKEQGQAGLILKNAFAEPCPQDGCALRRGRKKRVPYSKAQLKELEREFASSKFISRDRRRKISAATNLSERQITIWFQNRRVKDKKVVAKIKTSAGDTA